ncbi:MAG: threonine/serine dehydratase [Candidatus Bathyarchaeia archaeon]
MNLNDSEPSFEDVLKAREAIRPHLRRTPLINSPTLSNALGFEALLKLENLQPISAFKIRGGINLVSSLSNAKREKGLMTASTGNHGQSIAFAGRLFGAKVTVLAPIGANRLKVKAMKELGAEVRFYGKDFEEARMKAEQLAQIRGYTYVHPANEPLLIAGVGTITLEILEDEPDVDVIIAAIGGGSTASGACLVVNHVKPKTKVIGVQASKAPSVFLSWKKSKLMSTKSANTFAEGLATRTTFELPFGILARLIDDIVLVTEKEMKSAIRLIFEKTHQVAEGAGAASTAAGLKLRRQLRGKKVAMILSGGNITREDFCELLCD